MRFNWTGTISVLIQATSFVNNGGPCLCIFTNIKEVPSSGISMHTFHLSEGAIFTAVYASLDATCVFRAPIHLFLVFNAPSSTQIVASKTVWLESVTTLRTAMQKGSTTTVILEKSGNSWKFLLNLIIINLKANTMTWLRSTTQIWKIAGALTFHIL